MKEEIIDIDLSNRIWYLSEHCNLITFDFLSSFNIVPSICADIANNDQFKGFFTFIQKHIDLQNNVYYTIQDFSDSLYNHMNDIVSIVAKCVAKYNDFVNSLPPDWLRVNGSPDSILHPAYQYIQALDYATHNLNDFSDDELDALIDKHIVLINQINAGIKTQMLIDQVQAI